MYNLMILFPFVLVCIQFMHLQKEDNASQCKVSETVTLEYMVLHVAHLCVLKLYEQNLYNDVYVYTAVCRMQVIYEYTTVGPLFTKQTPPYG